MKPNISQQRYSLIFSSLSEMQKLPYSWNWMESGCFGNVCTEYFIGTDKSSICTDTSVT